MKRAGEPRKPVLIYDGACNFCRFWIARWRERSGPAISYRRSRQVAERFPEITAAQFGSAVQLIEPGGAISSGADAVFRAFDLAGTAPWPVRLASRLGALGLARPVYRFVAQNRQVFSRLTRALWGRPFRRPTFFIARWVFLRLLGAIYFVAFVSLLLQIRGLVGKRGILPAAQYLEAVKAQLGAESQRALPTIFWLNASDGMLVGVCLAGALLSLAVVFNFFPALSLVALWVLYLSLTNACGVFLGYQWDALLLEAGFLAIFLAAPFSMRPDYRANPLATRIAHYLLLWLAFRLTLESGVVKLASGDQTWRDLTALTYHYETQPLPVWTSWYLNQAPLGWQKFSTLLLFAIELGAPFTMLAPARVRRAGCGAMMGLQALIAASGNYCFFNYLTGALYVLLLDDDVWPRRWRSEARVVPPSQRGWPLWLVGPVAAANVLVTTIQLASAVRAAVRWPEFCLQIHRAIAPFRTFNGYGLFAVMTTTRPEIIIEGSHDGVTWLAYEFKWKPGDLTRRPRVVAPHQPRLDWQMWFAALGSARQNLWFTNFLVRLLEGSPEVRTLLRVDPFPGAPPRYVRALLYEYRFTRRGDDPRAWWEREQTGVYHPAVTLQSPPG